MKPKLFLHASSPSAVHIPMERGPLHAATVTLDSERNVADWIEKVELYMKDITRIESPDLGREWVRVDGKFILYPKGAQVS